jgi:hypothetical protein
MLKIGIRIWRSHPVLAAAVTGAIFGAANVVFLEIGGLRHRTMTGVLPFLFLSPVYGSLVSQMTALQVTLLLLIEVAGNVLGFALVFAAPVALVVGIRRLFRRRKSEPISNTGDS